VPVDALRDPRGVAPPALLHPLLHREVGPSAAAHLVHAVLAALDLLRGHRLRVRTGVQDLTAGVVDAHDHRGDRLGLVDEDGQQVGQRAPVRGWPGRRLGQRPVQRDLAVAGHEHPPGPSDRGRGVRHGRFESVERCGVGPQRGEPAPGIGPPQRDGARRVVGVVRRVQVHGGERSWLRRQLMQESQVHIQGLPGCPRGEPPDGRSPVRRNGACGARGAGIPAAEREREDPMGRDEKMDNKLEELRGKAKETVGRATGDEELEAQGDRDQTKSNLKQAGEKVKDAFRRR
jgi:uncharacterized protein YjbJ (UPF0337 family)